VTILNPAPVAALLPQLLAATDWLVPNELELEALASGDPQGVRVDQKRTTSARLQDSALAPVSDQLGARLVVTLGSGGAALVNDDGSVMRLPAERVNPVDTTGAGDAFVGAFAYGLAAGFSEADAVRLAIACASDSVTRRGAQTSFPDRVAAARYRDAIVEHRQSSASSQPDGPGTKTRSSA
jgi:ribokinase